MKQKSQSTEYKELLQTVGKFAKQIQKLDRQRLKLIEPDLRRAMKNGNQDLQYLEQMIDVLFEMQYSSCLGEELLMKTIEYLKTFAPESAEFYIDEIEKTKGID
jgi:hypothetical protein